MKPVALRAERLRSHRLTAPAPTAAEAAGHMLAVQSQEFWGGRWALASRSRGAPTIRDVDALFEDGTLVRSWTQRGTLHIVSATDLRWMLRVTGERQLRAQAPRLRELGLDPDVLARVDRAVIAALQGGGRLTRAELFEVFTGVGVDPTRQRGAFAIGNLALRGVICQGPVVPRSGGVSREQYFVLVDEHIAEDAARDDEATELFVRYIDGHGPATAADFAWWSGLTLTAARAAASAAVGRVDEIEDAVFAARVRPRRSASRSIMALPSFEEYYISYADRTAAASQEMRDTVGPGVNGMVRPILLAEGRIIGTWRQSIALGRHGEGPEVDPMPDLPEQEVAAALDRYRAFVTG